MARPLLIDTDVVIDYLRGVPAAADFLESRDEVLLLSAVSVAELYAGVREGPERRDLAAFVAAFEVVLMDRRIAEHGGLLRRDWRGSHGTGLADALIAATAHHRRAILVTLHRKHFPMLADVQVPYLK